MKIVRRLWGMLRRTRREREMAEEMETHLAMQTERNRAAGMSGDDARYAALRRFGGVEQIKEEARDLWTWRWIDDLYRDVHFGGRMLLKHRGFSLVCIAIMALGVGANTAMFSVLNAVVLRPLPVPTPERIMRIWETNPARGVHTFSVSYPNFDDWTRRSRSWSQMAAVEERGVNLLAGNEVIRVWAQLVTRDFLPMIGSSVALGRGFAAEDESPGQGRVAILSDGFWRRQFNADLGIVDHSLVIDGVPYTIIGVLSPNPGLMREAELFLPLRPFVSNERTEHALDVYGLLRPTVTRDQADSEMVAVARQIEREHPDANAGWSVRVEPLSDVVVGAKVRRSAFLVFGVAGLFLLIACANFSGLQLVRSASRANELAVRAALGGGRGRLVRQLLTESMLLAVAGGVAGVFLAAWSMELLRSLANVGIPRAAEISLDHRVLWFSAVATVATGAFAGLLPARSASRVDLQHTLKAVSISSGKTSRRLRNALIVAQLALSIVLLAGGGLLVRTLYHLHRIDLGYQPESVITARIAPEGDGRVLLERLIERVRTLPNVRAVGAISVPPMMSYNTTLHVFPVGPAAIPVNESIQSEWRIVTADYFQAMQIPLRRGRGFLPTDNGDKPRAVIVNETLARRLWGDDDPIGRQINPGGGTTYSTVIGVAGDVRSMNPGAPPEPGYYMSAHRQLWGAMSLVVRTTGEAELLIAQIRAEWKTLHSSTPIFRFESMTDLVDRQLAPRRTVTVLLTIFALLALVLAAIGLYGVMAHSTSQRTREVGIRIALGAQRADVLWSVLKDGAGLIAIGAAAGLGLSIGFGQLLRGMLADISPADPAALAVATSLLVGAALFACYLPARRAAKGDPVAALRAE